MDTSEDEIDRLLSLRAGGQEKAAVDRSAVLDGFLAEALRFIAENVPKNPKKCAGEVFDGAFRRILEVVQGLRREEIP